jgi:hypothetical protein
MPFGQMIAARRPGGGGYPEASRPGGGARPTRPRVQTDTRKGWSTVVFWCGADDRSRQKNVRREKWFGTMACTAIAGQLFLSEGAISKYTTTIFAKLGLAADDDTNRRVRAVLTYLGAGD